MKQCQFVLAFTFALLVLNPLFLRISGGALLAFIGPDMTQRVALPVLAALMTYTWLAIALYVLCGPLALLLCALWSRLLGRVKTRIQRVAS
jgi:hypothetical protein